MFQELSEKQKQALAAAGISEEAFASMGQERPQPVLWIPEFENGMGSHLQTAGRARELIFGL